MTTWLFWIMIVSSESGITVMPASYDTEAQCLEAIEHGKKNMELPFTFEFTCIPGSTPR